MTPPLVFSGRVVLAQELHKERTFIKELGLGDGEQKVGSNLLLLLLLPSARPASSRLPAIPGLNFAQRSILS